MPKGQTRRQLLTTWGYVAGGVALGQFALASRTSAATGAGMEGLTPLRQACFTALATNVSTIDPRISSAGLEDGVTRFKALYTAAPVVWRDTTNLILDELANTTSSSQPPGHLRVLHDWVYSPRRIPTRLDPATLPALGFRALIMAVEPYVDLPADIVPVLPS